MKKALIAMSGGVDSSVAAFLTQNMGYECVGCTMKLYDNEDAGIPKGHTCCSLDDVEDARSVARKLGMPYYVFNFKDEFREKVMGKFVDAYRRGVTPNPCIDCNRYMKFDKLFERARVMGCDHVVTGHYARIAFENGKYVLRKALDETKDQSYVLYNMTQEQLAMTLFPLGELKKSETRRIAEENGFVNARKHDSQDICFVPDGDYAAVVERLTGEKDVPGNFVRSDGTVLGQHKGIIHYTVGQRRGLGISADERIYVCRICPENRTVVLGKKSELFSSVAEVGDVNWISGSCPAEAFACHVKIRYRQKEQPARLEVTDSGHVRICFEQPQCAIAPGQAAVFYNGDEVLGGGVIC